VILNEIRLGRISIRNVEALVIPGDALAINLLGMTFLNRLTKFESAGGQLVLVE
jgi:aspartyl protease family protein